jgi:hypothetical protein
MSAALAAIGFAALILKAAAAQPVKIDFSDESVDPKRQR